jgi:hypothetical protein
MTLLPWHVHAPVEVQKVFPAGPAAAEKAVREDVEDQVHVGWRAAQALLVELDRWRQAFTPTAPLPTPVRAAPLLRQLTVNTPHGRIVVAPFDGGHDDRVFVWMHDDREPRRMLCGPIRAAGLRALGQHFLRCADVLDQHAPQPNGDPA